MIVKGKVALVTGGASGIGLICAEELLKNGVLGVMLVDINEQNGITALKNLGEKYGKEKIEFFKCDVSNKNQFEKAFQKTIQVFKHLDIFFNNAGVCNETNYEISVNVNVMGSIHGLKLALDKYLPKYKSTKEAIIINTSSIAGLSPYPRMEVYSSTKFAVLGLTRNFGNDFHFKRTGVKVIAIAPGPTETALVKSVMDNMAYVDDKEKFLEGITNFQTVQDIGKCFIKIVEVAENGSVWTIINGKEKNVEFPVYF